MDLEVYFLKQLNDELIDVWQLREKCIQPIININKKKLLSQCQTAVLKNGFCKGGQNVAPYFKYRKNKN